MNKNFTADMITSGVLKRAYNWRDVHFSEDEADGSVTEWTETEYFIEDTWVTEAAAQEALFDDVLLHQQAEDEYAYLCAKEEAEVNRAFTARNITSAYDDDDDDRYTPSEIIAKLRNCRLFD